MIRKHKNDFAGKENIPTFEPVEPAKPLRNAQIGGSFFIYMETVAGVLTRPGNRYFFVGVNLSYAIGGFLNDLFIVNR